jgi:4-diphosphocytidyl-2-C-methyl-D-erythritol kinase
MPLRERAPAKINLGLHVLRRRPDGYHDVETVLHRVGWADVIEAEPADTLSMTCTDPALPTDGDNLCLQAARRLAGACGVDRGARLHLDKRVPYGAGLGSGSTDAAATLRLLCRLWGVEPPAGKLHAIAAALGADVPFFLLDAPAAYAEGRGDELRPLYADGRPYRLPTPVLVAAPPVAIATPDAYEWVAPSDDGRSDLMATVVETPPSEWGERVGNDFEAPVERRHPEVGRVRAALMEEGAAYASLSGSGAAVYALFDDASSAASARDRLGGRFDDVRFHLTSGDG